MCKDVHCSIICQKEIVNNERKMVKRILEHTLEKHFICSFIYLLCFRKDLRWLM